MPSLSKGDLSPSSQHTLSPEEPAKMQKSGAFTSLRTQVLDPSVLAPQVLIPARELMTVDTQTTEDKHVKMNIIGYTKLFLQLFIH